MLLEAVAGIGGGQGDRVWSGEDGLKEAGEQSWQLEQSSQLGKLNGRKGRGSSVAGAMRTEKGGKWQSQS